ncbi:bifunctional diaminohydroxyphosphoribosylaminopyrimidine deaminase/5-amino-6-(5-phosphoribosylamino)uracil reductase RibD [Caulobacter sp. S45]|uniref:bifunctional diaminohydroxyphosphoribosylaminopyrimidine deaminase/5-amino-6-(5-phosphoribosylamino)uracil reductase RibD n=1 Tax=Caulobacter sp. S45 TaxID=1641861 RepID=UPI001C2CDA4F|nr:bifunctional diaminohydroxyphosphoribosylaminopyrimidine deaminase/5-amino-6-(5-phosphoribosylamino)uracil reductase RibD [Caulobacter sp. S45]
MHEGRLRALAAARERLGATAPNPPVGAAVFSAEGEVLGIGAHLGAGRPHAEIEALRACGETLGRAHSMFVTLEPCNHQGQTPPCTAALLQAGVRTVWIGALDPNPNVRGGGGAALRQAGVDVRLLSESALSDERGLALHCEDLIAPYTHWLRTGRPYVTLKRVFDAAGRMEPPPGRKTFSSHRLLEYAHHLRRESDAVLTGSGTVLADRPEFTVRHVLDFRTAPRRLSICDRRGRVDAAYLAAAAERGLLPRIVSDVEAELDALGAEGVHQLLAEAGPALTDHMIAYGLWDRLVTIRQFSPQEEQVTVERPV